MTRDIREITDEKKNGNIVQVHGKNRKIPRWIIMHSDWAELVDWGRDLLRKLDHPSS